MLTFSGFTPNATTTFFSCSASSKSMMLKLSSSIATKKLSATGPGQTFSPTAFLSYLLLIINCLRNAALSFHIVSLPFSPRLLPT